MTRRLLRLTHDCRFALGSAVLSGFLGGLLTIGQAFVLSRIVSGVFLGGWSLSATSGLFQVLIILVGLRALLVWLGEISSSAVAGRVQADLRRRIFEKLQDLGPAYVRRERTGELVNAAVEGIDSLEAYFSQYVPQLILAALIPVSILIAVFPHDPLSGIILFLTAPLIPVFLYLIGKAAESQTHRQWKSLSRLSAFFLDSLQGLTTLKEMGRSFERADAIAERADRFKDVTLGVLKVTFLSALVLELVATISTALVAVEVGLRLWYGRMAFQPALFLLLLVPEFYIPLRMLGLRFHAGMSGASAARRIFEILDLKVEHATDEPRPDRSWPPFTSISISGLSYTYPDATRPALQDINLEIAAGQHVALVGESGAGKSTLAGLLLRFMRPSVGSIRVDGKALDEIPLAAWRDLTAWVPQAPHLFHDSLSANLRLARPHATPVEISSALQAAHLEDFIRSLPGGLETVIGEAGARLSAGQAQRLALARAFLKDAPILILDESTSSLDPEQEQLIASGLHRLMHGRTVITIAHRLSTVFQADRIFVFEKGHLVETGDHASLLARKGVYARLVGTCGPAGNPAGGPEVLASLPRAPAAGPGDPGVADPVSASQYRLSTVLRLLGFLNGSWGWVALSVLLGVLTVASNVGLMGSAAYLICMAALRPDLGALQLAIVGVRFFGISRGVFRYTERLTSHNTTFRLLARLRSWFYRCIEPLAPARLMQLRSGDLLARLLGEIGGLENFYVRSVAPPLVALVLTAGMVLFLSRFDLSLACSYLGFSALLGLGVPCLSWILTRADGEASILQRAHLQSRLVDGIQGLAEITVFDRDNDYLQGLIQDDQACRRLQHRLALKGGFTSALMTGLVNLGMLAVLAVAIPLVTSGSMAGVMLAVLPLMAVAGFEAVLPLPMAAQTLSSSLRSARRLFDLADSEPAAREPVPGRSAPTGNPSLQFSGLDFTYPGSPERALSGINFCLNPGKRLAVVGPSGSGKSTLFNLLMRFWDYSQGHVLLEGHELTDYPQEQTRRLFSVSSQREYFFHESIRQNLLLARSEASQAELEKAARQAHIHDFILELPAGYATIIGEHGVRLSGGERQRLALARAFLKNAAIFLLDEPTANLDPATERRLLEDLYSGIQGQSLLLITHRLVGLEHMDEILVLEHGCIVERGTQAALLAREGLYQRLWRLQNQFLADQTGA